MTFNYQEYNEKMNREADAAWENRINRGVQGMPKVSEMILSKFINQGDVQRPLIMTVRTTTFDPGDPRSSMDGPKWLMWFNEHRKPLKLNNTMLRYLEQNLGDDSEMWQGKRIKVYWDHSVQMAGQAVGGVRIMCREVDIAAWRQQLDTRGLSAPAQTSPALTHAPHVPGDELLRGSSTQRQPEMASRTQYQGHQEAQAQARPTPPFGSSGGAGLPSASPVPDAEFSHGSVDTSTGEIHERDEFDDDIPF